MTFEEKMAIRELIAAEINRRVDVEQAHLSKEARLYLRLGKAYSESQAAAFIQRNVSTLKRGRASGDLKPGMHYTSLGERGIRYIGYQIVDFYGGLNGPDEGGACPSTPSGSPAESGGSGSEKASTTDAGSTLQPDKQTVSALAQKTFQRQKND